MCRHIYDWNIVDCDVKQPVHLTYWRVQIVLNQKLCENQMFSTYNISEYISIKHIYCMRDIYTKNVNLKNLKVTIFPIPLYSTIYNALSHSDYHAPALMV